MGTRWYDAARLPKVVLRYRVISILSVLELTTWGLGVGIVSFISGQGEKARCSIRSADLITRRPAAPIRPSLH